MRVTTMRHSAPSTHCAQVAVRLLRAMTRSDTRASTRAPVQESGTSGSGDAARAACVQNVRDACSLQDARHAYMRDACRNLRFVIGQ